MLLNVPLLREFGCMDESARFEYEHPLIYSSPFQLRMMLILKYKLMNSANHILWLFADITYYLSCSTCGDHNGLSDLPDMKSSTEIMEVFGVHHEVRIVSAYRTPETMFSYALPAHA
ncbi:unnamed protein product [Lathyrus oleraceus]